MLFYLCTASISMYRETILIVDDEQIIRDLFMYAFDEYRIIAASSGEEALSILREPHDIRLVILDVRLPGIHGTEVLREIKTAIPDCKVVILTGYGSKDVAVEVLRLDADEFIEKPFDIEETRAILRRQMDELHKDSSGSCDGREERIRRAIRLINRNYNKQLSLNDVSRELYLCPKYFSRLFREKTGKSFIEYRIEERMRRAKEFLEKSAFTVSQIAYKVGYQSPDAFMKIFKQVTGMRPLEYRCASQPRKSRLR